MASTGLGTFFRTAHHVRWSQLIWRVRYRLAPEWPASLKRLWQEPRLPRLRPDFPHVPLFHRPGPSGSEAIELLGRGTFRHLNRSQELGRAETDWRLGPVRMERLWTITLHYHAWLYELAAAAAAGGSEAGDAFGLFRNYLAGWLSRCAFRAPGARSLAWNSYAIGTRLSWWIRSHLALGGERFGALGDLQKDFLASLWQQAAYLHDHLEWDIRANHLLRNAVGLAWAGRFFQEPMARTWLTTATAMALEQVEEQVLPDGGHYERSPMYHLHVMEDLLSLALLVEERAAAERLSQAWQHMAEFLTWVQHPDGQIPLFNDGGLRGSCEPDRMLSLGKSLGRIVDESSRRGGRHFSDFGMVVWKGTPWTLFLDVGPVGPDYQPGHAHADTLTLECSYKDKRLFVDPGTYGYDQDARRTYDRSTDAHNTVCIDRQDSSEMWHIFRVGRRAYPRGVRVDFSGSGMDAEAGHSGYDHLPGRPQHRRRVTVQDAGRMEVSDRVEGKQIHLLQGGYLLDPAWTAEGVAGGWQLRQGPHEVHLTIRGPQGLELLEERRPYHPDYGSEVETTRLGWRLHAGLPASITTLVEVA